MRPSPIREVLSPEAAVYRAFWTVKVPSMVLLLGPLLAFIVLADKGHSIGMKGFVWFLLTFLGGLVFGWLAWSFLVSRWRLWAYERVTDISELKDYAVVAKIIWPEGHFFERTEIASKALRTKLRELELANSIKFARNDV